MSALGLEADKQCETDSTISVYRQNMLTVKLFIAMSTQWRISMDGVTGLDYGVLPVVARGLRIKLSPSRFEGVRVMEAETLRAIRESK